MSTGKEADIQWYVAREGKQHGPLSEPEMRAFIDFGHLQATDLIWRAGFPDWRPAPAVFPNHNFNAAPHASPAPGAAAPRPGNTAINPASRPDPAAAQPSLDRMSAAMGAALGPAPGDRRTNSQAQGPQKTQMSRPEAARRPEPSLRSQPDPRAAGRPAEPVGPRRSSARTLAILLPVLALAGGGGWYALNQPQGTTGTPPLVKADPKRVATPMQTKAVAEATSPAAATADTQELDARFQKMALWTLIKQEFPDWYGDRLKEAAKLTAENQSPTAVNKYLAEALVALRRKHAEQALSASSEKLRFVASAFLDNLKSLRSHSTEACYSFISQGETSPLLVDMMAKPEHIQHIQAQSAAIFAAIAEGRKSPTAHGKPVKGDYDVLAAELARLGWSQADLQLFADPKSLARSPPERVCSMVQDWFTAHLAVKDPATQERLLVETLRPVVAG